MAQIFNAKAEAALVALLFSTPADAQGGGLMLAGCHDKTADGTDHHH